MDEQITTTQLVSDLTLRVFETIDEEDVGSKENLDKINIVMKGVNFISDEDKKDIQREESEKDRELERLKIESNERIKMAEIEANKKNRLFGYFDTGVKAAGVFVDFLKIVVSSIDNKAQRKFDLNLAKMNIDFRRECDLENRNFIDEQNLKSYIFEETGTARSTANKRTEKLLDSYSRKLNEFKN